VSLHKARELFPIQDGIGILAERAMSLSNGGDRVILGITGSPGAGKTTLAKQIMQRVNEMTAGNDAINAAAVHLPMDGYHLANSTLDRLGTRERKGAVDTFDGWGFIALIRRLLIEVDHTVYAPSFDRNIDEGIAGEIAVPVSARIVILEGNYLLLGTEPWSGIADLLTESWFCETTNSERVRRLVERHQHYGRSRQAAQDWAENVDGANSELIEACKSRADLTISGMDASIVMPSK
jgi:pantothenate kinase